MNYLSKNIRFLRKTRQWSQEALAGRVGVKRSSIAAYESKNVRPRLDFIVELSKLFEVRMSDLIEKDLEAMSENGALNKQQESGVEALDVRPVGKLRLDIKDKESVTKFIERSVRIRKMLEGFKVFYRFKLESFEDLNEDARRLSADIENFLLLMEHLLAHNEAIISAISEENSSSDSQ